MLSPRRSRAATWRSFIAFVWPSAIAAICASTLVGIIEGALRVSTLLHVVAAGGYFVVIAAPASLAGSVVIRVVWRSWRVGDIITAMAESGGGVPQLAAWLSYGLLALSLFLIASLNTLRLLLAATSAPTVVNLAGTLIMTAAFAVLVALSWPSVQLLTRFFRAVDRVAQARRGRSVLTPPVLATAATVALLTLLAGTWFITIKPSIGPFDTTPLHYAAALAAIVAVVHTLWPQLAARRRLARVVNGSVLAVAIGLLATGLYARYQTPYTLLEIWGETTIAGQAIDRLYNRYDLRGEVPLDRIRPRPRKAGAQRATSPDIIVMTVETLRADRTPVYGGQALMPNLTRLARRGAVFEWAFAPSNNTRRSLPAMMLGQNPDRIRGRVVGWALRLDPRHFTVAERFRAANYQTAGFFCCRSFFDPSLKLGLSRGFVHISLTRKDADLAERGRQWIAQYDTDRPLFVWFHFFDPHDWEKNQPPEKGRQTASRRYDRALSASDHALTELVSLLLERATRRATIIVYTSDHGEGVGDHGQRNHSTDLYNSQIHVPLVIVGPGVQHRRIQRPVGLVDLTPTLLDLAGYTPPGSPDMDGVSLAPLLRGEDDETVASGRAYAVMVEDRSVEKSARAAIAGRHKYIEYDGSDRVELYNFVADPKEKRNLARAEPQLLRSMREHMARYRASARVSPF
ncbi:MAG: sulfatase-like hydrolase/transferase [Proteobacteria bacterium]|nr:sulfatase-like hydrolase/transferase [Pseudomonadota bacterium]